MKILPRSGFLLFTLNIAICLAIFFIDTKIASAIAVSITYIVIIMLSLWLPGTRYSIDIAVLCSILTVLGFYLSPEGGEFFHAVANRGMSLFAIWITTGIAIYHKKIALAVEHKEHKQHAILAESLEPIIILNAKQKIQSVSQSITKFFQWQPSELIGKDVYILMAEPYKTEYRKIMQQTTATNSNFFSSNKEVMCVRKDNSNFTCEISLRKVSVTSEQEVETIFTIILHDVEKRKANESKLIWLASHDGLTELFNRRYFDNTFAREWKRLARTKSNIALILLDIDFFKKYNDIFGHQAGDKCLQAIAKAIKTALHRPADFVARYGGEEFVILLPNTNIDGAMNIAQNIQAQIKALNLAHSYPDFNSKVTVSIGITASKANNESTSEEFLHQADLALYKAKEKGRNRFIVFDVNLNI